MNDIVIKMTTAGWVFMGVTWAIVLVGAGLCVRKILAVKSDKQG